MGSPRGEGRGCGGCGRPVPAPCPYCHTYHCSLHCSLVTNKKKVCPSSRWWKWLRIICCIFCILLVLALLILLILAIFFWDKIFGSSTTGPPEETTAGSSEPNTEAGAKPRGGEPAPRGYGNDDSYGDEYYDYKYV